MPRIARLEISNFKRIRAVAIQPNGSVVEVRGRNGAGKSSVLDAIAAALGGEKLCPREPIRRGADGASVRVELDNGLVVERRWTASGRSTLTLTTKKDGVPLSRPQTRLDDIIGRFSFDPLAFMRLGEQPGGGKQQAQVLREISGVDFTLLDGKRARAYEERTIANRAVTQLRARLASIPETDVPDAPVSGADLMAEQQRRSEILTAHNRKRVELDDLRARHERNKRTVADHKARIADLERQLERERATLAEAETELEANRQRGLALKDEVEALVDPDMAEIPAKLRDVEKVNESIRQKQARKALAADLTKAEAEAKALDDAIQAIDTQKAEVLADAKLPVPGLSFTADGVTYDGLPLESASQAQQLRISVAIGSALNPELRAMLIRDGSLLDESSLALLREEAEKADLQVWLEIVSSGPGDGVVIEDGMVEGAPAPAEVA